MTAVILEYIKALESRVEALEKGKRTLKWARIVTGPFETREELREEVKRLDSEGLTGKAIAEMLGVSDATVNRIKKGDVRQRSDGLPIFSESYQRSLREKASSEHRHRAYSEGAA